jgi:hypothetical protein
MTVVILPQTIMRLASGQSVYPGKGNYTDSSGNVWYAGPLVGGDASCNPGTESCFGYSNGGSWPASTDILLYETPMYAVNDLRFDFIVPNGNYSIGAKFANNSPSDQGNFLIETQGAALDSPTDIYNLVGSNKPYDYAATATVTNNKLSFVLRAVNTTGNNDAPFISALSISQTSSSSNPPAPPTNLIIISVQ